MPKGASLDHPSHELISSRWSPYSFSARLVPREDLLSLFEAARRAASSFDGQPWRYVVANRDRTEEFERVLSCLLEGNRRWARDAPVVALGCVRQTSSRNHRPNRVALHDLGLAAATLTFETSVESTCNRWPG